MRFHPPLVFSSFEEIEKILSFMAITISVLANSRGVRFNCSSQSFHRQPRLMSLFCFSWSVFHSRLFFSLLQSFSKVLTRFFAPEVVFYHLLKGESARQHFNTWTGSLPVPFSPLLLRLTLLFFSRLTVFRSSVFSFSSYFSTLSRSVFARPPVLAILCRLKVIIVPAWRRVSDVCSSAPANTFKVESDAHTVTRTSLVEKKIVTAYP